MNIIYELKELNNYKRPKSVLMPMYINERLNATLAVYDKESDNYLNELLNSDSKKVLRELNKYD